MKNTITIWKKELKDTIRDRRTLMASIILPLLLMPGLIIGMGKLVETQIKQAEEKVVKIAIERQEAAPAFMEVISSQEKIEVVSIEGNIRQAVKDDEIDAGIIIPENFNELIDGQQPVPVTVVRKSINTDASTAVSRVSAATVIFNKQLLATRFSEESIDQNILSSISINTEDLATEKEQGGFGLGLLLPLFIIMWSVIGGQYTAIDISAGEKERKTLESLLLAPVRRLDVVFGKFLAVSTTALISVIVALGSMYAAIVAFGPGIFGQASGSGDIASEIAFSVEPMALLILFGVSILLVLMFSAIQLSIAIFAKSYKEAQSYIGPSYLLIILPTVIVNMLPNLKPALWFFILPIVNAVLLFKEVLIGDYNLSHILVSIASLVVFSAIAIFAAVKIYSKEGILFRD